MPQSLSVDTLPLADLLSRVRTCQICAAHLPYAPRPVLRTDPGARLLIVGQAPGTRVHATGIPWNDPSGRRLWEFSPRNFVLPHPSPRNQGWLRKHPWFAVEVVRHCRPRSASCCRADEPLGERVHLLWGLRAIFQRLMKLARAR